MKRERVWWVEEVGSFAALLGGVWGGMGLLTWLTDGTVGLIVGTWLLANAVFAGWMLLTYRIESRRRRRRYVEMAKEQLAACADLLPPGTSVSFHDHPNGYVWSYMTGPGWVRGEKKKCSPEAHS